MEPFEVMISESQERMLCVVEPDKVDDVLAVCGRWEVRATAIGEVTSSRRLRVYDGDDLVGDMPVEALVDDCPLYDLDPEQPDAPVYPAPPRRIEDDISAEDTLLALLGSPNVASKRWAFEQYDFVVGSRTARRPEQAGAAVLSLEPDGGTGAIAMAIDGNGRRVACDPRVGAIEAVLECAQNLACVGAEPLGLTNCLNFGNPEKPHIAWQLTNAVEGLADACTALGVPVVGGNVSLYNEGGGGPIFPTPVVGMVGRLPDAAITAGTGFAQEGHEIALVGPFEPSLDGSELEKLRGAMASGLATPDLDAQAGALDAVRAAVRSGALASAHDISDGGLACALAECSITGGMGARVELPANLLERLDRDAVLFGEGPGGFVVAGPASAIATLAAESDRVRVLPLGTVGGDTLEIGSGVGTLSLPVSRITAVWTGGLPDRMS
jgi:phosphoribosylformylglycinamidine synthase